MYKAGLRQHVVKKDAMKLHWGSMNKNKCKWNEKAMLMQRAYVSDSSIEKVKCS